MRRCPFDGCELMVPDTMFGCRRHWFSISKQNRALIYQSYHAYKAGAMSLAELRAVQERVVAETQGARGVV